MFYENGEKIIITENIKIQSLLKQNIKGILKNIIVIKESKIKDFHY